MNKERFFDLTIVILASILFYFSTKWGLNFAGGDAMAYYEVATLAQHGEGIFSKITSPILQSPTHWSPGISFLAAFFAKITNINTLSIFTFLNYILLIFNVLLFKKISKTLLENENYIFFATSLFLISYPTLTCHLELSSEPLFTFFTFLGFAFWKKYENQTQTKNLIFVALFFGLAAITRYVGIILIFPVLYFLLFKEKINKQKIIVFCCLFFLFPALIFLRSHLLFNEFSDRNLVFHPLPARKILQFGQTILAWFSPLIYEKKYRFSGIFTSIISTFIFLKIFYFHLKNYNFKQFITFYNLFVATYLTFLVFSISVFDVFTDLDYRILYPIFPFFLLGIFYVLEQEKAFILEKKILIVLLFSTYILSVFLMTLKNYTQGNDGSTSPKYRQDKGILFLKEKHPNTKIYSNIPDILKMNGLENVAYAPSVFDPCSLLENKNMEAEIAVQIANFQAKKAIFIFARHTIRNYRVSEKEISAKLNQKPDTLSENILIFK